MHSRSRPLSLGLVFAAALLPTLATAQTEKPSLRFECDFGDQDLADAMEQIGRQVGVPILVDAGVNETVSVSLRDIPWRQAVDVIARMTRCDVKERYGVLLLEQPAKITLAVENAPLTSVVRRIAQIAGVNVVYSSELVAKVSVDLKQVRWDRALRSVAAGAGASIQIRGDCVVLSPRPLPTRPEREWVPNTTGAKINVDVEGTELVDVVREISKHAGSPLVLDASVDEELTIALREVPWQVALYYMARQTRCEIEELSGGVLFVSQAPKVTLDFDDADVRTVLQLLAAYSGENLILADDISGKVSVHAHELDWRSVLTALADVCRLELNDDAFAIQVTRASKSTPATLKATRPKTLKAADAAPVDVVVEDVDLADVMEQIGRRVERNILVDPSIEETVTVSLRKIPWRGAVEAIARMTRCEVEERPGGILLLTQPPKVTIQASRAPADVFLRMLAAYSGKNLVTGPGVAGLTVSVNLKQIHYLRALRLSAGNLGLTVTEEPKDSLVVRFPKADEAGALPLADPGLDAPAPSLYSRRVDALLEELRILAKDTRQARVDAKLKELSEAVAAESKRRALALDTPTGEGTAKAPTQTATRAEIDDLLDALFEEIESLAQDRQVEELIGKFAELSKLISTNGRLGVELANEKLHKWRQRLRPFGEVMLSIQLQMYTSEGNHFLKTMAEAIRQERYNTAIAVFGEVKELKDRMYSEEREIFHRNAEAFFLRGKALTDRAVRLRVISKFELEVSAIVVAPPYTDEKDATIINGRVHYEGDPALDADGNRIPNMSVVEIIRSTIRFRYEDTEFVRELRLP